ncbi:flagellar export chaperone FlgN [Erwiniaceae bacterium BAC15a-03b]|uniref:Flagellar export chaperone FlgN n=1 Tax=Winslowiella arboricola TaxID=2978220 RepID=A0A9J6PPH6_9GAMM|nr:flagellar export chaperone FlgN [Winslowiella arboricola]MCU5775402.1 flagellar export chaperone FlgN [Winslowiella arboricola]MCU5780201.1 flagellar export chaperone FlgN [Winslowiella arboricola]
MNSLLTALDKMQEVLSSLTEVMDAEQQQLSAGRINSNLLQRITEDKSSLLNTVNYLDGMRNQAEKRLGLQAPYATQPDLARRWEMIQKQTARLHNTNRHSGMLLNLQIEYNEQALSVLKPQISQPFYGPDGQTKSGGFASRKV